MEDKQYIKLTPEDSGNLEQIAISIQKIEKILGRLQYQYKKLRKYL